MKVITRDCELFEEYLAPLLLHASDLSSQYESLGVRYCAEYVQRELVDCSFVIELAKQGVLLVLVSEPQNGCFDFFGLPVALVWKHGLSSSTRKGALKVAITQLQTLIGDQTMTIRYQEPLKGPLSEFARFLLHNHQPSIVSYQQCIDLFLPEQALWSGMRKIYRANVRWGLANMQFQSMTVASFKPGTMETFRQFHIAVAGKETRSLQTWALQELMIEKGEAFAVYGYLEQRMVAASLFIYNSHVCQYAVGVYARDLFDKSISHALVWQGILQAKALGCGQMIMGDTYFSQFVKPDGQLPNDKELSISHFKQGFGGELLAFLNF